MIKKIYRFTGIVIILSVLLVSCGEDKKPLGPEVDVSNFLVKGWEAFENTPPDLSLALEQFSQAISLNSNSVEAYTGRGWTYARMAFGADSPEYSLARDNFDAALQRNNTYIDAWAGDALVNLVLNNYEEAKNSADYVIDINSSYVFSHDNEINYVDILIVKAQSHYYLGEYAEVVLILNQLQPGQQHYADQPDQLLIQLQSLINNN
ncbi:tetratricopeptide repeat protein [candidate division KSB1 bacterium]